MKKVKPGNSKPEFKRKFSLLLIKFFTIGFVIYSLISCNPSKESLNQYLDILPSDLVLHEDTPQKYILTVKYFTNDIYGNLINRMKLTANYTRALPDGMVCWNNVRIARTTSPEESFSESELQAYMENFTYKPSGKMLNDSFFKDFPPEIMETRVLIWDMMSIEVWAWNYFDILNLNETYQPAKDGETFQMTETVSFHNKDLRLTWVGLSKMNDELCALIQYESLFNPLEMNAGAFTMKGRTNYWGNIWVSLEDKQIEFAVLNEDGLIEMTLPGQNDKTLVNIFRDITINKDILNSTHQ